MSNVDKLISQVRSQLDEDNTFSINDEKDILPALNRAQDYAMNILARHYEDPLLAYYQFTPISGISEYDIPEDALEDRIEKLEILTAPGVYQEVPRIRYRDITKFDGAGRYIDRLRYTIVGKKIRLVPVNHNSQPIRVWYLKAFPTLVPCNGTLVSINVADNYVIINPTELELTSESDELGSYVNIVDGTTGLIKGSFQIKRITDSKIEFRSSPVRSVVLGRTILSSMANLTIEPDDYICTISGTCVSQSIKPVTNFLIQYAVAELTRKLGGEASMEETVKKDFEKLVERSWAGRESTLTIKRSSPRWVANSYRKIPYSGE